MHKTSYTFIVIFKHLFFTVWPWKKDLRESPWICGIVVWAWASFGVWLGRQVAPIDENKKKIHSFGKFSGHSFNEEPFFGDFFPRNKFQHT